MQNGVPKKQVSWGREYQTTFFHLDAKEAKGQELLPSAEYASDQSRHSVPGCRAGFAANYRRGSPAVTLDVPGRNVVTTEQSTEPIVCLSREKTCQWHVK